MPSFGYLLPTRGSVLTSVDSQTLASKTAADVVGLARRAESLGFDSVWVGDSVLAKPRHDPLSALSAVAAATDAVGLGTAVHLPVLRHPVHVAHRTATVDQLSGGRFRWGVGVGIGPDVAAEFGNLGIDFQHRGAMLDEVLDVVTALWQGEAVDYDGDFYELEDASIGFQPVSEPPIYVASAAFDPSDGFPRRISDRLVEHGGGWLPTGFEPSTYADGLATVHGFLEDAGRSPDAVDPATYLDVVIGDEAAAIDTAREFYERYYPARNQLSDDEVRDFGVFGPAEAVASALEAYEDAGVGTFVVRFTTSEQRSQLRRFADLVGGQLR